MTRSMSTPCDAWAEKLTKHPDELSFAERVALEVHLTICPDCALAHTDYHMMGNLLRVLPAPSFPAGLPPQLLHMWEAEDAFPVTSQPDDASLSQNRALRDETLQCDQCGLDFIFTADVQAFFHQRGVSEKPKRCPACHHTNMLDRGSHADITHAHETTDDSQRSHRRHP